MRLDSLLHFAAIHANGRQQVTVRALDHWLNQFLSHSPLSRRKDPAEDIAVGNVLTASGNRCVLIGDWSNPDYYLQYDLDALDTGPDTLRRLRAECDSVLSISDLLADPNRLLTVEAVVVFGSFLSANDELGDLDIAIKHRHRNPNDPDPAATALAYAERSGRHFSNIVEWISWPETELRQLLKARKRTIAIQEWHTFLRMTASGPDHFQYRVVFGSAEDVAAEIHARSKNR